MLKLIAGVRLLVAHHALFAELHMLGQTIVGLPLVLRDIGGRICCNQCPHGGGIFSIFFTLQSALYQNKRRRPIAMLSDGAFAVCGYYSTVLYGMQEGIRQISHGGTGRKPIEPTAPAQLIPLPHSLPPPERMRRTTDRTMYNRYPPAAVQLRYPLPKVSHSASMTPAPRQPSAIRSSPLQNIRHRSANRYCNAMQPISNRPERYMAMATMPRYCSTILSAAENGVAIALCHSIWQLYCKNAVAIVSRRLGRNGVLIGCNQTAKGVGLIVGTAMPQTVGAVHHACVHSVRCYGVGKRIGSRSNGSSVLTAGVQHSSVDGVQITGFFSDRRQNVLPAGA